MTATLNPLTIPIPEACRLIGIGRSKFYELVASGEIPAVRLGRRTLIPLDALRAFIEAKAKDGIAS